MKPERSLFWSFLALCLAHASTKLPDEGKSLLPVWETLLPQHDNEEYRKTRPRTRYAHTATVVGQEVIVVHGYFYDHKAQNPTLLGDVWAFKMDVHRTPSWRLVSDSSQTGPQRRMSHTTVAFEGKVIIFGGDFGVSTDDKGITKLNDVWELDVQKGAWTKHYPKQSPEPRCSHSAVVLDGAMFIFGGQGDDKHLGDLWRYKFHKQRWKKLIGEPEKGSADHPGKRGMHEAVAAPNGKDMYVLGGFRWPKDKHEENQKSGKLEDLWLFSLADRQWHLVPQAQQITTGKSDFGLVLHPWRLQDETHAELGLVTFAGSQCNPACNLVGHLSFFSLRTNRWYPIEVMEEPIPRYQHALVVFNGSLWTFGGETYQPYMYHNSVQRIVLSSEDFDKAMSSQEL